ncbi:MAG: MBL fold metallo-hydrolase [Bacillota bacterium]|nr:MBL fold metallo-hydrolase [Bacillota bacterium]
MFFTLQCSNYQDISIGQGSRSLLDGKFKIKIFLYVVDGLAIDAGPFSLFKDSSVFYQDNLIDQVVLTHVHEDHSGMAAWLQDVKNVPIYLHQNATSYAKQPGNYKLYRQTMWGERPPFKATPVPAQLSTEKYSFEVIDAPGHANAHNIFHEKNNGWLFTGDLYLGTKQVVAFIDENMAQTIASIQMILRLDFDTIFCAHSGVWENGKELFKRKLEYLQEL